MSEETFETPQPRPEADRPLDDTEQKSTAWIKIILVAVLGFGLLAASACTGYWYGTQEISNLKNQISNLQPKTQIPETPTPTTEPTPAAPETLVEKQMGYIKSVYEEGGKRYLEIDGIQWFWGEEAIEVAMEDTGCRRENCTPNGYYIRNQDDGTEVLEVFRQVVVKNLASDGITLSTITFVGLMNIFSSADAETEWLRSAPYNVESQNGLVTGISQQYIP